MVCWMFSAQWVVANSISEIRERLWADGPNEVRTMTSPKFAVRDFLLATAGRSRTVTCVKLTFICDHGQYNKVQHGLKYMLSECQTSWSFTLLWEVAHLSNLPMLLFFVLPKCQFTWNVGDYRKYEGQDWVFILPFLFSFSRYRDCPSPLLHYSSS